MVCQWQVLHSNSLADPEARPGASAVTKKGITIDSKISIIGANCRQLQPNTVSKETSKDTQCGTATPHCSQGAVEHVIAK